jgi:predicted transcriptional regulator of viral defense system
VAVRPADLADWLLSRGRSTVTTAEAAELLGIPANQVRVRLHSRRAEFVSPVRGLWLAVPPENRLWGAPEGIELIDLMMTHLGINYYVGWLSAAAIHGAAHHSPQVFQVATSKEVADRRVGRTSLEFRVRRLADTADVITRQTRSGSARVSSREITTLDVATDPEMAGGIDNVATVICTIFEDGVDLPRLVSAASNFPTSTIRRIGYVVENIGGFDASALLPLSESGATTPTLLNSAGPRRGALDRRWKVRINREIEAEF